MLHNPEIASARPDARRHALTVGVALLSVTALMALVTVFGAAGGLGPVLRATPALAAETGASSCQGPADFGSTYLTAAWPGGFRGVPVYSNGVSGSFTDCLHSTRTPRGRVVVDGYEWQCVELVDRLYLSKGWIDSAWLGNGDQMYANAPSSLSKQPQGSITHVAAGDVISFDGPGANTAGHAAVISEVQGDYVTIVNQDVDKANVLSHAYLKGGRIEMVGWAGWTPLGVVDAPGSNAPKLKTRHTTLAKTIVEDGYERSLSATGGSGHNRWSKSAGALPAGMSLTSAGELTGMAMTTGSYHFTASVADSIGQRASEGLDLKVSAGGNLLSNGDFASAKLSGWHLLPAKKGDVMHATSSSGVTLLPAHTSELKLTSKTSGGSLFQDVTSQSAVGDSYTLAGWVRAARPASAENVCLRLSGLSKSSAVLGHDGTCRTVGSSWTELYAPYDVNSTSVKALRASIVVNSKAGAVDLDAMSLQGNGLSNAAFGRDVTAGWHLLSGSRGDVVNGRAYPEAASSSTPKVPAGDNFFQMNTSKAGGSLYQDVDGALPVGQRFRFATWLRSASGRQTKVCVTLWGLGHVHSAHTCEEIGASWVHVSVPFQVKAGGEDSLRAQVYVDTARNDVDMTAPSLYNTTA